MTVLKRVWGRVPDLARSDRDKLDPLEQALVPAITGRCYSAARYSWLYNQAVYTVTKEEAKNWWRHFDIIVLVVAILASILVSKDARQ